jgi:hypothetical protein
VVDGNYFDASGDVFTAVIVALDDNGNVSQCVFLDENAKTKQIIYCPINPNTIYFNEAGGLAEVKHLFAVMSPKEICQCVTAMTGIPVDYCFVMDKNSIKSIAALMDDCYSVMPGDVTEIIRYTVTEEEQTVDLPAGEYEVKITNIGNQVKLNEELYGKTKLEGEKFIEEILDKYFILRTAWLYGLNGPNFVKTMLALTESYDEVTVVYDQVGSPTYTHDLALAISELLESDKYGIYHLTNAGECSWYEYCMEFYALAGKDTKVRPVTTEEFPRPAPRPHYSVLSNEKWIKAGFTPMRSYKEALKDYLNLIL